jgi:hypothetical protein
VPTLNFDEWCLTVDALCRTHLACGWRDLAGDPEPLERAFEAGESPMAFVRWWADKYDLIWVDSPQRRAGTSRF